MRAGQGREPRPDPPSGAGREGGAGLCPALSRDELRGGIPPGRRPGGIPPLVLSVNGFMPAPPRARAPPLPRG
ncbi:hypothetical protein B5F52_18045 [Flavonifractor plautii]|nr:hypothetical protein B5F52_18045 [Flavonifractor plautii]